MMCQLLVKQMWQEWQCAPGRGRVRVVNGPKLFLPLGLFEEVDQLLPKNAIYLAHMPQDA